MRYTLAVLALLITSPVFAQAADESTAKPPLSGRIEWTGFMEGHDHRGLHVVPITATLTFTEDKTTSGRWLMTGRWTLTSAKRWNTSGDVTGAVDSQGNVTATLTLFTAAGSPDGKVVVDPERCPSTTKATGRFLYTNVFRWTASRIHGGGCEDLKDVTWTLQPVDKK